MSCISSAVRLLTYKATRLHQYLPTCRCTDFNVHGALKECVGFCHAVLYHGTCVNCVLHVRIPSMLIAFLGTTLSYIVRVSLTCPVLLCKSFTFCFWCASHWQQASCRVPLITHMHSSLRHVHWEAHGQPLIWQQFGKANPQYRQHSPFTVTTNDHITDNLLTIAASTHHSCSAHSDDITTHQH